MDENSYQIAEQIVQLHQKAYAVYLPLVEDVCSRIVPEDELSHLLDYLLDFACDEKMLGLYICSIAAMGKQCSTLSVAADSGFSVWKRGIHWSRDYIRTN